MQKVSYEMPWHARSIHASIKKDLVKKTIEARYGNLFQMYEKITDVNPYEEPMILIYPAIHYTMGGLWVDYNH